MGWHFPHGEQGHPIEVLRDIHLREGRPVADPSGSPAMTPEELAAAAAAHRAHQARRAELAAAVAAETHPVQLAELLERNEADVAPQDCRAAWGRLLALTEAAADFEAVEVRGRHTIVAWILTRGMGSTPGCWKETGRPRFGVWRAEGVGRLLHPRLGEIPERWETGFDVWLDADGNAFRGGPGSAPLSMHNTQKECVLLLALPSGRRFETVPGDGKLARRGRVVPDGVVIQPHETAAGYAVAVAAALRRL